MAKAYQTPLNMATVLIETLLPKALYASVDSLQTKGAFN
jgi:hypothetical protein